MTSSHRIHMCVKGHTLHNGRHRHALPVHFPLVAFFRVSQIGPCSTQCLLNRPFPYVVLLAAYTVAAVHATDTTKPVISREDVIAEATSTSKAGQTIVTWTAPTITDAVTDGILAECRPPSGSPFSFGITPATCTATDAAGNEGTVTFNVKVQRCTFDGFYSPLDRQADVVNVITASQTVPCKFSLKGDYGLDILRSNPFDLVDIDCDDFTELDSSLVEVTTAQLGSALTYDASSDMYQINFKAKDRVVRGKCYALKLRMASDICETPRKILLRVK